MTSTRNRLVLATTKNKKRVTLFVNPTILIQAKAQSVVENLSLTKLVEKALIAYLPTETVIKKAVIRVAPDP